MEAKDVIRAFWIPSSAETDVILGNRRFLISHQPPGTYSIVCANSAVRTTAACASVVVDSADDFETWLQANSKTTPSEA